jgi:hypothetical protein
MRIIKRIKSKTPLSDKLDGQFCTKIGLVCATILATGLVVNPIGIVALSVGAVVFGGKAVYHAQKVER